MFLVPFIVLLAPVPVPIVVMAQHSSTIGWFAAMYIVVGWIVIGSFKAVTVKKMAKIPLQATSPTRASASTALSPTPAPAADIDEIPDSARGNALPPPSHSTLAIAQQESEKNPLTFELPDLPPELPVQNVQPAMTETAEYSENMATEASQTASPEKFIQEENIDTKAPQASERINKPSLTGEKQEDTLLFVTDLEQCLMEDISKAHISEPASVTAAGEPQEPEPASVPVEEVQELELAPVPVEEGQEPEVELAPATEAQEPELAPTPAIEAQISDPTPDVERVILQIDTSRTVLKCPNCRTSFNCEGNKATCPSCSHTWDVEYT